MIGSVEVKGTLIDGVRGEEQKETLGLSPPTPRTVG